MFVDSHCHLDFPGLAEREDEILATMAANDVGTALCISVRLEEFPRVLALAERHAHLWASVGVHPDNADCEEPDLARLLALADHPRVVAIGETGLDYHYTPDSAALQQASLRRHIEAAQETGLPLVIHARAADEDMEAILAEGLARAPYSCVMHCFSSGPRLAEAALEMGFYLSMSGIAAFPKSQELRDIFADAPIERVLLETDAPYLAPPPHRGRRNEPAYLPLVAEALGNLFGVTADEIAAQTTATAARCFTLE